MLDYLHQVNTELQTTGFFASPVIASVVIWLIFFTVVRYGLNWLFLTFCNDISIESARLPAELPHPNPAGEPVLFPISLVSATQEEIQKYIDFRKLGVDPSNKKAVAQDAAKYKGELLCEKILEWEVQHFELKKKNLKFPSPALHWNGWAGWWAEVGPYKQSQIGGNLAFALEHIICGFIFPMNYLFGEQLGLPGGGSEINFALALYGDIGANIVTTIPVLMSYATGDNYTLEKYSRPLWSLMVLHHVAACGMGSVALSVGDACPKDLACLLILSLLGTTGAAHLLLVAVQMSPIFDNKFLLLCVQGVTTLSMVWFRVFYWVVLVYRILLQTYVTGQGIAVCLCMLLCLCLFTLFNIEFVGYHFKALTHAHTAWGKSGAVKPKTA